MKTLTVLFAACLSAIAADTTVAKIYDGQLKSAESEIVGLTEAMPAAKFDFAPTQGEFKGVRTFGQQAKHLSAVIYLVAAAMQGEKSPGGDDESGPAAVKTKEQIVKYMKDAFAYAHKAIATLTPQSELTMVKSPFGNNQTSKGSLAAIATWHSFDHYGQMVVYARMNGVVPPASR
jgi:uncharacterized damage-inducible protein DinB